MPRRHVFDEDGVEYAVKVLGHVLGGQQGGVRHAPQREIAVEQLGIVRVVRKGGAGATILRERERQESELNITAGKQRGKLAREQIGVRAGDVDVAVFASVQRVDCSLKALDALGLVDKHVAARGADAGDDVIVELLRRGGGGKAQALKINRDD